mgnify:FL=1
MATTNTTLTNISKSDNILSVDYNEDSSVWAFGDENNDVYIYNGTQASITSQVGSKFTEPGGNVNSVDFS